MKSLFIIGSVITLSFGITANAKSVGKFRDWTVHVKQVGGEKICYALSQPTSKVPSTVNHGDIYFMIASWKSGAAKDQPSLYAGYTIKTKTPPMARIGASKVVMFSDANEAFVEEKSEEQKLVRLMKKGSTMRVDAVSARGTRTSYEFSLRGVTAAIKKANALCK